MAQLTIYLDSETQGKVTAACAWAANAELVTHNAREFRRVPGLKVKDWLEK